MRCVVPECGSPVEARGWCQKHYLRWYKHGDPLQTATPNRRAAGTGSTSNGYALLPHIGSRGTKSPGLVHRALAEKALGRKLTTNEVVHHINEDPMDNRPENLLVCTRSYHRLLHVRMQAYEICGNPTYRKCLYCGTYDDPTNMTLVRSSYRHKACHTEKMRVWTQAKF